MENNCFLALINIFEENKYNDLMYFPDWERECKEQGLPFSFDGLGRITDGEIIATLHTGDVDIMKVTAKGEIFYVGLRTGYPRNDKENFKGHCNCNKNCY